MFDSNTNIIQKKTVNNTFIETKPQDIDFEVTKTENKSFFRTMDIGSITYNNLMGENPFMNATKSEEVTFENSWKFTEKEKRMGSWGTVHFKIPVEIIKITSIGNGKVIVELIKQQNTI